MQYQRVCKQGMIAQVNLQFLVCKVVSPNKHAWVFQ